VEAVLRDAVQGRLDDLFAAGEPVLGGDLGHVANLKRMSVLDNSAGREHARRQ
jgi:hypothetical protein